jgi:hypothetical protein
MIIRAFSVAFLAFALPVATISLQPELRADITRKDENALKGTVSMIGLFTVTKTGDTVTGATFTNKKGQSFQIPKGEIKEVLPYDKKPNVRASFLFDGGVIKKVNAIVDLDGPRGAKNPL